MEKRGLAFNLVTTRMLLDNLCDGFDTSCSSKKSLLTTKIKMLHLLNLEGKLSPSLIICKLGIAKSNLAILASGMIVEGLIEKIEDSFDKRVIYYAITSEGKIILVLSSLTPKKRINQLIKKLNFKRKKLAETKLFFETLEVWLIYSFRFS